MKSIAIYSRKSKFTGKGESIENQINKCKKFIEYKFEGNVENIEVFIDEGFSGKNEDRPEYQKMMKLIKNKEIDSLIIYKLDRLGRNARDIHNAMALCTDLDCTIYSAMEGFDTSTSFGRAVMGILASLAQLEREQISERVADNMYSLARMGRWLGGQTPLGFESEQITYLDPEFKERSMYRLVPVDEELLLVKLIYDKYLEFKSLRKVTQYLLENNFKTKLGADWNIRSVSDLLQNPTYVRADKKVIEFLTEKGITCAGNPNGKNGILTYNKKKGKNQYRDTDEWIAAISKHEGVIKASDWLTIQNTLEKNKTCAPKTGRTHNALLSGLLRCAKCGSPMNVIHGSKNKKGKRVYYYGCSMKIYSKGARCNNSNIRYDEIEEVVINKLKQVTQDKGLLINQLNELKEETSSIIKDNKELKLLKTSLESHLASMDNLVDQLSQTDNSKISKYIISKMEQTEEEIIKIKSKIEELENTNDELETSNINLDIVKEQLNKFYNIIDDSSIEEKRFMISCLVDKITWDSSTGLVDIKLWGSPKKK
ncbi:recombinase family protein [Clostridium cochlearium]|uniref:recombinase family protein n=1 Tax=Clostridium cochlearium TaxID=1494 RepID=UPI001C0EF001|nr:recombinase family protein [Clostridium cochlearium]MBU5269442.1 recombinase family protein [Clostridium cochlearium]